MSLLVYCAIPSKLGFNSVIFDFFWLTCWGGYLYLIITDASAPSPREGQHWGCQNPLAHWIQELLEKKENFKPCWWRESWKRAEARARWGEQELVGTRVASTSCWNLGMDFLWSSCQPPQKPACLSCCRSDSKHLSFLTLISFIMSQHRSFNQKQDASNFKTRLAHLSLVLDIARWCGDNNLVSPISIFDLIKGLILPFNFFSFFPSLFPSCRYWFFPVCSKSCKHSDILLSHTIEECQKLFDILEDRADYLHYLVSSRNNFNFLRICIELKRRLSKSSDPVFSGRILMFMAYVFPLTDKSGTMSKHSLCIVYKSYFSVKSCRHEH